MLLCRFALQGCPAYKYQAGADCVICPQSRAFSCDGSATIYCAGLPVNATAMPKLATLQCDIVQAQLSCISTAAYLDSQYSCIPCPSSFACDGGFLKIMCGADNIYAFVSTLQFYKCVANTLTCSNTSNYLTKYRTCAACPANRTLTCNGQARLQCGANPLIEYVNTTLDNYVDSSGVVLFDCNASKVVCIVQNTMFLIANGVKTCDDCNSTQVCCGLNVSITNATCYHCTTTGWKFPNCMDSMRCAANQNASGNSCVCYSDSNDLLSNIVVALTGEYYTNSTNSLCLSLPANFKSTGDTNAFCGSLIVNEGILGTT